MPLVVKKNIGWTTIIVLCLLPILRWFLILPLGARFFDINAATTSLGQIAGLLGITLFSINLILSSRLKILDKYFYGLNVVYSYHRVIGTLAFSLLLFHPLLLAVKYINISTRSAAMFFLSFSDLAVVYGRIALFLMIVLISITFYAKIKYQRWKLSHKFMVLVFVFALLHVSFISSDISRDLILRFYVLGLAGLGLAASLYHSFISKFYNHSLYYRIIKVTELNEKSVEIEMEPLGREINFSPGQFIFVSFLDSVLGPESHPFSIASAPADSSLKMAIKSLGDFTGELKKLRAGETASVEGPFGKFSYKNFVHKNQIWVAGGIGITPFISMAKDLPPLDYKIDLYYCVQDKAEAVLIDELLNISSAKPNFRVIPWYSKDRGRIDADKIMVASGEFKNKEIMLCGPVPFMISLKKQLLGLRVPKRQIHWEKFNLI